MPQIEGWFRARKSLPNRRRVYYEDIYGHKDPEEDLEGVHILSSESDSEPEISSPRRRLRDKTRATPPKDMESRNKDRLDKVKATPVDKIDSHDTGNDRAMEKDDNRENVTTNVDTIIINDDDSDLDERFIADLQRHGMFARNIVLESR